MSVRAVVPQRWHGAAQDAYVGLGRVTARFRMAPSFVIVGASRSGTTSLFRALTTHPLVRRPTVNKGIRYFDLNYYRPTAWYYGHFPMRPTARGRRGAEPVTFEASGYYLFHPFAVERLAREIPEVRIVAMLRDPIERAFSAWKHESARGFEWETFPRALELEDERLLGEADRMRRDPTYESFTHRHLSHRHRGEYAEQLERVYSVFPRSQVHVLESERFFMTPESEYRALLEFLGLPPCLPDRFEQHNARPSAAMPSEARAMLAEHYSSHDDRLAELLGYRTGWMR